MLTVHLGPWSRIADGHALHQVVGGRLHVDRLTVTTKRVLALYSGCGHGGDSCDSCGGGEGDGVDDNGIDCVDSNSHDGVGCVSPPLPRNHFDVLLGLLQYIMVIIMDNRKITLNNLSL